MNATAALFQPAQRDGAPTRRMTRELTAERLRNALAYDPLTGTFTWLVKTPRLTKGEVAGAVRGSGYLAVSIGGTQFYCHRLAILYATGSWPAGVVDHIDGNRKNNALVNLRDVNRVTNMQNQRRPRSVNPHGLLGVSTCRKKFKAEITIEGRRVHLGVFDSPQAAHACYVSAKRRLHEGCTI